MRSGFRRLCSTPILQYKAAVPADLHETGRLVQAAGGKWLGVTGDDGDIRKIAELRSALEKAQAEFGKIDIVVANAGIPGV